MKDCDKNKELPYLKYCTVNNLYGWAMLVPVDSFKILLNLMKISSKAIKKKVTKDIFLKLVFNILKNCMNFNMIYHFFPQ